VIRQKHSRHSQPNNPSLGLRKFFEEGGHELVVTSDNDGLDSEFERELPDAPPAALGAAYYAQRRRPAAG
jgi:hypothetical protein